MVNPFTEEQLATFEAQGLTPTAWIDERANLNQIAKIVERVKAEFAGKVAFRTDSLTFMAAVEEARVYGDGPHDLFVDTVIPVVDTNLILHQETITNEQTYSYYPTSIATLSNVLGVMQICVGTRVIAQFAAHPNIQDGMMFMGGNKAKNVYFKLRSLEGPGKGRRLVTRHGDGEPETVQPDRSSSEWYEFWNWM